MAETNKLFNNYKMRANQTTASDKEVDQFEALADQWWDPEGAFAPLHKINPVRMTFIRDHLVSHFGIDSSQKKPFKNLSIIFNKNYIYNILLCILCKVEF